MDDPGNYQGYLGVNIDTGKKLYDPAGVAHTVYRRYVNCGALPNNTTSNVAHGVEGLDITKPGGARLVFAHSSTKVLGTHRDLTIEFDATNVNLVTQTNLSGYTESVVEIEFCLSDESAES